MKQKRLGLIIVLILILSLMASILIPQVAVASDEGKSKSNSHQEATMVYLMVSLPSLLTNSLDLGFESRVCYEFKSGVSVGLVGGYSCGYDSGYSGYSYSSLGLEVGRDIPLNSFLELNYSGTFSGAFLIDAFGIFAKFDIGLKTKFYPNIQLDCFGKLGPYDANLGIRVMVGIPVYVKK